MTNVGARLQEARVQRDISIQELSARTKIREVLLVAIERGDFERLPKGLLARGFIRAYAREVGLDPEVVVRQFADEFEPAAPVPASVLLATGESVEAGQHPPRRNTRWSLAWAVTLVIGVATPVVYFSYPSPVRDRPMSGSTGTAGSDEGARGADIALDSLDPETHTALQPDVGAAADDGHRLTVEINPTRVVWVQAVADGQRVLYELVDSDQRRVIKARQEIVFRVGDAEAFQYTVNTVRGRTLGGAGAVREIRISQDNYTAFQNR
jgi:cytoskeleton protein RodZ